MHLDPTLASNGRTLLRVEPLRALQQVIDLGVARDPDLRDAAAVLLRPLQLLDALWSEVDGVFHNHPPAIDRMRLGLASSAGWQHWLARLLQDGSPLHGVLSSGVKPELDPLGLVDMGALGILCHAALRVAGTAEPTVMLETPLSLALSAAPAEALARVSRDLHAPDAIPTLLRGLELASAPPLPEALQALLAAPEELARWTVIASLRRVLERWETVDREELPATRWEAATADQISSIEVDGDHVLVHGLDLSEDGSTVVLFAPSDRPHFVSATPDEPVPTDDGVRVALPSSFRVGWLGRQSRSLLEATNTYRARVRERWETQGVPGVIDAPFVLVDDIVTPAAPPRTRSNQIVVGPALLWVDVQPSHPAPGAPVMVQWEAAGASEVRVEHGDDLFHGKASGRIEVKAPAYGRRTVTLVPLDGPDEGPSESHAYTVAVTPGLEVVLVPAPPGRPPRLDLTVDPPVPGEVTVRAGDFEATRSIDGTLAVELPADLGDVTVSVVLTGLDEQRWDAWRGSLQALPSQPRTLVVVRAGLLADSSWHRADLAAIEQGAAQAGLDLTLIELPVVPDELAVLIEPPWTATRLLEALERLAVCSPGGAHAWWVVWVPGGLLTDDHRTDHRSLLETRTSATVQGLAVATEDQVSGLMEAIARPPRPVGEATSMLRVTGRVTTGGVQVGLVRQEVRQRPLQATAPVPTRVDTTDQVESEDTPEPTAQVDIGSMEWVTRNAQGDVLDSVPLSTRPGPFALLLPSSAEVVTLQVRLTVEGRRKQTLFERNRARQRPRITFESWDTDVATRYEHDGQVGARLSLELSRGGVWTEVAELDPCPGQARVDPVELGPADSARVVAVDGWNTAHDLLDGDPPASRVRGRIRLLPDGSLTADAASEFRWRVDGTVRSSERVFRPPTRGRVQLELGPPVAPLTTLEWRSR